jgi:aspartate carbamoyltransferase catalytic subunit
LPQNSGLLPGKAFHDLATGIDGADVVICLRLQKERMSEGVLSSISEYAAMYQVNRETLKFAAPDCLVMHPGPINRGIEVDDVAADGENSAIAAQIENGIFVRMASLYWCFTTSEREAPEAEPVAVVAIPKSVAKKSRKKGT